MRAVGDGASVRRLELGAAGRERRGAGWGWERVRVASPRAVGPQARAPFPRSAPPPGSPLLLAPLLAPGCGGGSARPRAEEGAQEGPGS